MRGYFFGNMYLSSIQQGIQAAHVVTKIFADTPAASQEGRVLYAWASQSVTKILLNGGNQKNLEILYDVIHELAGNLGFPCAKFYEDQDSLGGALTSVGVIVPEHIYDFKMKPDDFLSFARHFGVSDDQSELRDIAWIKEALPSRRPTDSACLLYYALRTCRLAS